MPESFEDELARLRKVNADTTRLTVEEVEWLRENRAFIDAQKQAAEHEAWLRGRMRVLWPWILSIVATMVAVADWIYKHIKFS